MASDRPNWLRRLLQLFGARSAPTPPARPLSVRPRSRAASSPPARVAVPEPPPKAPSPQAPPPKAPPPQAPPAKAPSPQAPPAKAPSPQAPSPPPVAPIHEPRDAGPTAKAPKDRQGQRAASAQKNRQTLVEPVRGFLSPASLAPPAESPQAAAVPLFEAPVAEDRTEPCRPPRRPPVPLLHIFDDGQKTGQIVWIRRAPLVIGRSQGDVRIPHDDLISDPHAEVVWRNEALLLHDLQSRHGMFLRVSKARLNPGQEIRVGAGRYRFEGPGALVELDVDGQERRLALQGSEVWIGRGADSAPLGLAEDGMVDPRHARLSRDPAGRWHISDNNSLNGTWLRMRGIQVKVAAEFLLGEQRFRLELPSAH